MNFGAIYKDGKRIGGFGYVGKDFLVCPHGIQEDEECTRCHMREDLLLD